VRVKRKEERMRRGVVICLFVVAFSVSVVALPTYSDDYALSFDGVDDTVTVPDSGSLDLTTGLTLEAWVQPDTTDQGRFILGKWNDGAGDWSYGLTIDEASDKLRLLLSQGTQADLADVLGGTSLPAGAWTHVAATYDGSQARVYVNGALDGEAAAAGSIQAGAADLLIGAVAGGTTPEAFGGRINEVRVWNVARTEAEIRSALYAGLGGGEYVITQPITFRGKELALRVEAGTGEAVIRMDTPVDPRRGSVVIFENGEGTGAVLDGFTLTGGSGSTWPGGSGGGGILC
jgi:hypothetical protein